MSSQKFYDSPEAEKLKKLISDKKQYLIRIENQFVYQKVQQEILFLEKEILPIVLNETNVIHSEISKYTVKALEAALKYNCNGFLVYFPIYDKYEEQPIIGVANPRSLFPFRTIGAIEISIDNMDGYGVSIHPINLPLNELM